MANHDFIAAAIKRPGALTSAVGGKPSQHLAQVRKLAKTGGRQGAEARFYLNVLKPGAATRAAVMSKLKKG